MSSVENVMKMLSGETASEFEDWIENGDVKNQDLLDTNKAEFVVNFLELIGSHRQCILKLDPVVLQTERSNSLFINAEGSGSFAHDPIDEIENIPNISYEAPFISAQFNDKFEVLSQINFMSKISTPPHPKTDESNFLTSTPENVAHSMYIKCDYYSESSEGSSAHNATCSPFRQNEHKLNQTHPNPRTRNHRPTLKLCDFLKNTNPTKGKKNKKRLSGGETDVTPETELDISNPNIFPAIGEQNKKISVKDKKRVAPVTLPPKNTDKTPSPSHTGQNTENDNIVSESPLDPFNRDLSMEKFKNKILKVPGDEIFGNDLPPVLKAGGEEPSNLDGWVAPDPKMITSKDILDKMVHIYKTLSVNNLVPSITSDMYSFLLILLSKQKKDQLKKVTKNLDNHESHEDIMKSIHNAAYFATKILRDHSTYLIFLLDRNTLKMLRENKTIRDFCMELAMYISNVYSWWCDHAPEYRKNECDLSDNTHGIVCWNNETDNLVNFPNNISFLAFKKQRDLFYEIYRSYPNNSEPNQRVRGSQFHSRVRSLLAAAVLPDNHAHLARLFVLHMISECLSTSKPAQQSKLEELKKRKEILAQRFTDSPGEEHKHLLPKFGGKELFYKHFLALAENDSFRTHVKDILICEIYRLDDMFIINSDTDGQDKDCIDVTNKFVKVTKTLRLLSKFLSYLTTLPYCQMPVEFAVKTGQVAEYGVKHVQRTMPKETIYERELADRNLQQPPIDLQGKLQSANLNGRLSVTLPWIVQYLSIMDYTGLRTAYYENLIKDLRKIFIQLARDNTMPSNNKFYLISTLSWLFDLPHFPQKVFFTELDTVSKAKTDSNDSTDSAVYIDLRSVNELCPFLKRFRTLLTSPVGMVRHVRPITIAPNPEDMQKIKLHEIQAALEQELLKSQPLATQRVIEMIVERITYCGVHDFRAALSASIESSKIAAIHLVNSHTNNSKEEDLLTLLKDMYERRLSELKTQCLGIVENSFNGRVKPAIDALIVNEAKEYLVHVAYKDIKARLMKWLGEHLSSTAVLCKDIEAFMNKVLRAGPSVPIPQEAEVRPDAASIDVDTLDLGDISPSEVIFDIKGTTYNLMYGEVMPDQYEETLQFVTLAVRTNNTLMRPSVKMSIFQLVLELAVMYITYLPDAVNEALFNRFNDIWEVCCPNRDEVTTPEPIEMDSSVELFLNTRLSSTHEVFNSNSLTADSLHETEINSLTADSLHEREMIANQLSQDNNPRILISPAPLISPGAVISPAAESHNQSAEEQRQEKEMLDYFTRVLCVRNIQMLNDRSPNNKKSWDKMAEFIVYLHKKKYITEYGLTGLSVQILQTDWSQGALDNLARCMRMVRKLSMMSQQFSAFIELIENIAISLKNF